MCQYMNENQWKEVEKLELRGLTLREKMVVNNGEALSDPHEI